MDIFPELQYRCCDCMCELPAHERYCEQCSETAIKQGYYFRNGVKWSPAIKQLVEESEIATKQTTSNHYF